MAVEWDGKTRVLVTFDGYKRGRHSNGFTKEYLYDSASQARAAAKTFTRRDPSDVKKITVWLGLTTVVTWTRSKGWGEIHESNGLRRRLEQDERFRRTGR